MFVWADEEVVERDNVELEAPAPRHTVRINVAYDDKGNPASWDVASCGCSRPWRHA